MKKLFGLLITLSLMIPLVLGSFAFAAKKSSADEQKYGFGVLGGLRPAFWFSNMPIVYPTFKSIMGDYSGEVGLNYTSSTIGGGGSTNSHIDIVTKNEFRLTKGKVSTHAGAILIYSSDSSDTNTAGESARSSFALGGYYGATLNIIENFDISADLIPIMYTTSSKAGVNTTILNIGLGSISVHYYF